LPLSNQLQAWNDCHRQRLAPTLIRRRRQRLARKVRRQNFAGHNVLLRLLMLRAVEAPPLVCLLALALPAAIAAEEAAVTFSTLTNVGDFWGGYHLTVNGVVEVCPRSPPNLLPFTEDTLLCTANGTMMLTTDGGRSWNHSGLSEVMRPFLPPPKWMQRIGPAGKPTTAAATWVGVNPVGTYICDYPKLGPCDRTADPPLPIVGEANHSYCDWGLDDATQLPVVYCGEREASVAVQTWR
jgi:hypothetical protein